MQEGVFLYIIDTITRKWRKRLKFLKENSYYIMRLFVTHIGMAVFGFVLFLTTNQQSKVLMLAAGIFSAAFYAVLSYITMWEAGAKDKPRLDAGRLSLIKGKGFFLSLAAQCPIWAVLLVFFVCSFFKTSNAAASVYYVSYFILTLFDGCFTGIMLFVNTMQSDVMIAIVFALGTLLVAAAAALGYLFGTKERRLIPVKTGEKRD